MKKVFTLFLMILLGGFITRWMVGFFSHGSPDKRSMVTHSSPVSGSASGPQVFPSPRPQRHQGKAVPFLQSKLWENFVDRFGYHLQPVYSQNGELLSIQSIEGQSIELSKRAVQEASSGFHSSHPGEVKIRAREILNAAKELIKIDPAWPLDREEVRSGPVSAQVFFQETYQGMPVLPGGSVKVDLGSAGELLALHSSYRPSVEIVNQPVLSSDQAKAQALQFIRQQEAEGLSSDKFHAGPGTKVVWVETNQGHIAYQFHLHGREIVVDAKTGEVLYSHDKRIYEYPQ
jgi:hypothetical protein